MSKALWVSALPDVHVLFPPKKLANEMKWKLVEESVNQSIFKDVLHPIWVSLINFAQSDENFQSLNLQTWWRHILKVLFQQGRKWIKLLDHFVSSLQPSNNCLHFCHTKSLQTIKFAVVSGQNVNTFSQKQIYFTVLQRTSLCSAPKLIFDTTSPAYLCWEWRHFGTRCWFINTYCPPFLI